MSRRWTWIEAQRAEEADSRSSSAADKKQDKNLSDRWLFTCDAPIVWAYEMDLSFSRGVPADFDIDQEVKMVRECRPASLSQNKFRINPKSC